MCCLKDTSEPVKNHWRKTLKSRPSIEDFLKVSCFLDFAKFSAEKSWKIVCLREPFWDQKAFWEIYSRSLNAFRKSSKVWRPLSGVLPIKYPWKIYCLSRPTKIEKVFCLRRTIKNAMSMEPLKTLTLKRFSLYWSYLKFLIFMEDPKTLCNRKISCQRSWRTFRGFYIDVTF